MGILRSSDRLRVLSNQSDPPRFLGENAIPDSGVSRYEFEQNVVDSWSDNDLTDNTSSGYGAGIIGDFSKSFDGVDDYLAGPILPLSGSISISFWLNTPSPNDIQSVVNNYGGGDAKQHFVCGTTESDTFDFFIDDGSEFNSINATTSLTADTWFMGTMVYDDSVPEQRIYTNGSKENTVSWSGTVPNWQERQTEIGGENQSGNGRYTEGRVDDVRFYNKALTDTEVSNLYNNGSIL